jgi:hypothetical protein
MMAYQTYRVEAAQPAPPKALLEVKDEILRARLALPAGVQALPPVPVQASPATLQAPMMLAAGAVRTSGHGPTQARLSWSPFHNAEAEFHALQDQSLVLAELNLDLGRNGRVRLGSSDLLRVRKLSPSGSLVPGVSSPSWFMQLAAQADEQGNHLRALGRAGLGQAWRAGPWVGAGWLELRAGGQDRVARLAPGLSLDGDFGRLRVSAEAFWLPARPDPAATAWRGMARARWLLAPGWSLAVDAHSRPQRQLVAALQRFF